MSENDKQKCNKNLNYNKCRPFAATSAIIAATIGLPEATSTAAFIGRSQGRLPNSVAEVGRDSCYYSRRASTTTPKRLSNNRKNRNQQVISGVVFYFYFFKFKFYFYFIFIFSDLFLFDF
jgi:hypothetical protein